MVAPIVAVLAPLALELLKLLPAFSSGSKVAERNIEVAQKIGPKLIDIATAVVPGAKNEQDAVEQIINNPTLKDVPIYGEWVASLDGLVNATIRAQVQGYLVKQNYTEGDFVRKGQVLFEIDPREYQAAQSQAKAVLSQSNGALEQSKAALAQSKGALEQTRAALEKAKSEVAVQDARWTTAKANLARIRPLAQQNAVSQKDLDDAIGTELSTRSAVEAAKAGVVAAGATIVAAEAQVLGSEANVEKAQLNLSFTRINSPVDGVAGIAKAQS